MLYKMEKIEKQHYRKYYILDKYTYHKCCLPNYERIADFYPSSNVHKLKA